MNNNMKVVVQERVFLQVGEAVRFLSNVSKEAANELISSVESALKGLDFFPRMHPLLRGTRIGELEYRQMILSGGRYALIYLIKDNNIYVEYFIDFRRNNKILISDLDSKAEALEEDK